MMETEPAEAAVTGGKKAKKKSDITRRRKLFLKLSKLSPEQINKLYTLLKGKALHKSKTFLDRNIERTEMIKHILRSVYKKMKQYKKPKKGNVPTRKPRKKNVVPESKQLPLQQSQAPTVVIPPPAQKGATFISTTTVSNARKDDPMLRPEYDPVKAPVIPPAPPLLLPPAVVNIKNEPSRALITAPHDPRTMELLQQMFIYMMGRKGDAPEEKKAVEAKYAMPSIEGLPEKIKIDVVSREVFGKEAFDLSEDDAKIIKDIIRRKDLQIEEERKITEETRKRAEEERQRAEESERKLNNANRTKVIDMFEKKLREEEDKIFDSITKTRGIYGNESAKGKEFTKLKPDDMKGFTKQQIEENKKKYLDILDIRGDELKKKEQLRLLVSSPDTIFYKRYAEKKQKILMNVLSTYKKKEDQDIIDSYLKTGGGSIDSKGDALTNFQINDIMDNSKIFKGCFMRDEQFPQLYDNKAYSYIINTDVLAGEGKHWVGVYCDKKQKGHQLPTLEYYDPLGDKCPDDIYLKLTDSIKTDRRFKENTVKNQSDFTENCGRFVCQFLKDRESGTSFETATHYTQQDTSDDTEKRWKNVKGGSFAILPFLWYARHKTMPRNVKNTLDKYGGWVIVPEKTKICRKPITKAIKDFGNYITFGALMETVKKINFDDIYHLYSYIVIRNPETGDEKILFTEKNERVMLSETSYDDYQKDLAESRYLTSAGVSLTINDMIKNAEQSLKNNLWRYSGNKYNCQNYIATILKDFLTQEDLNWLLQPADLLFSQFPIGTTTVAQWVTDVAETITKWFGIRGGR